MKRVYLSCVLLLLGLLTIQAQERNEQISADEIIDSYLEAIGGVENWQALTSTRMEVTMSQMGMNMQGVMIQAPPNKQRIEINAMGREIIQAYDGETAWTINPFAGGTEAQLMPPESAEQFTRQSYENDFINYAEKGHSIAYLGQQEVEGVKCYELKMTDSDGVESFNYFDSETMLLIMQKTYIPNGQLAGEAVETYFSNYQENDGLWVPTLTESKSGGSTQLSITINKVEYNLEMDESVFAFPKE